MWPENIPRDARGQNNPRNRGTPKANMPRGIRGTPVAKLSRGTRVAKISSGCRCCTNYGADSR
eukprot:1966057-Pyramimonas_sp.AAC.1